MPAPRIFASQSEPRAQWTHVLASVLALCGPAHRTALMREFLDEDIEGVDSAIVREFAPNGDDVIDIRGAAQATVHSGYGRVIVMGITADRKPGPYMDAVAGAGTETRYCSWLRVRDWVQERPERGSAEGVDLAVLQQAEYFLTPNVAELYRLEDIVPTVPSGAREAVTAAFFGLNDLSPAPRIDQAPDGATAIFPRTGDAKAQLVIRGGSAHLALEGAGDIAIGSDADWEVAASGALAAARRMLPRKR